MFQYCPPIKLPDLKSETFPDGKRYYTLDDGTRLPSVTTVLGAMKKQVIMEWRKRVGEAKAQEISTEAAGRGTLPLLPGPHQRAAALRGWTPRAQGWPPGEEGAGPAAPAQRVQHTDRALRGRGTPGA